ncbi:hypothetical protein [Streptomyces sp. JHA26]|uniref:hypothetical protein n=1 Tax=Streptomyces sp. JHA26 TaxID=1917143 RepID=UPI00098A10AB|nr:hypothetical protein [Streptomyces sp. JHA26]
MAGGRGTGGGDRVEQRRPVAGRGGRRHGEGAGRGPHQAAERTEHAEHDESGEGPTADAERAARPARVRRCDKGREAVFRSSGP